MGNLIIHTSFNSTLVQLKDDLFLQPEQKRSMFQFYLSSIKSYVFIFVLK